MCARSVGTQAYPKLPGHKFGYDVAVRVLKGSEMYTEQPWYSVKCVFQHDDLSQRDGEVMYEERIVVLKASSLDEAIALGEAEAEAYAGDDGAVHYTGFVSAFHLSVLELTDGTEVYSLMRQSSLDTDAFIDRYHDDGSERTQIWQPKTDDSSEA